MGNDTQLWEYGRNVRCSGPAAGVLAARLERAAPHDITPGERRLLDAILEHANVVARVLAERDRIGRLKVRPLLTAFLAGWSSFHDGLLAASAVLHGVSRRGDKATAVLTSLLPDGVSFASMDAETAWSEGSRRLDRIRDEHMTDTIHEVLGEDFLEMVTKVTADLAEVIGTGREPWTTPSTTALAEALAELGEAVGAYGRLVVGSVNAKDEASVERCVRALEGLALHRLSYRGGGGGDDTEADVEVDAPAPSPAPAPVSGPP